MIYQMSSSQREKHTLEAPLLSFDLAEQIRALKLEKQWKSEDRNGITLVKTPSIRIVLMVLHEGTTLSEHSAEGAISVNILSGSVEFILKDTTAHLTAPALLSLADGVPHSVRAIEESALLLTVIPKAT